jgi:hypothetical protein
MHIRIKRRKFGQLVISSAAATVLANIPGKSNAQIKADGLIYGVTLSKDNTVARDAANTTPGITFIAAEITSGKEVSRAEIPPAEVDNKPSAIENARKALFTQPTERITSLVALPKGRFAIASVASTQDGNFNRLVFTDGERKIKQKALKASGFKRRNGTIESLLVKDKQTLTIISLNGGIPPFDLTEFDIESAKIREKSDLGLPELRYERRYSNLALAPDGKIYATSLGHEGSVILVQIDFANRSAVTGRAKITPVASLRFNKEEVENDLSGLAISASGQIYALADPAKEGVNLLFLIDVKSGEMQLVRKFPVDKIAFALA